MMAVESRHYKDYLMVPTVRYGDKFKVSLWMLWTLERLKLTKLEADYSVGWHDHVGIWVDDMHYDEDMEEWLQRFA